MRLVAAFLSRCVFFTLAWAVLTMAQFKEWPLVLLAVTGAAASSVWLLPTAGLRLRLVGLARFVPYFLRQSVGGGWDVARRVFTPDLPLQSGVVRHTLSLNEEHSRVFFCWTISLLPGTACVGLSGAEVKVHVLDTSGPIGEEFRELEKHLAAVFGEEL